MKYKAAIFTLTALFTQGASALIIEIDFDTNFSSYESNEFDRDWIDGNSFEWDTIEEQATVFSTTYSSTVRIDTDYQGVVYHETAGMITYNDIVGTTNRDYSYAEFTQNELSTLTQNCPTSGFDLPVRCYNYSQLYSNDSGVELLQFVKRLAPRKSVSVLSSQKMVL